MTNEQLLERLYELEACNDAVAWAEETGLTYAQAWRQCPRADWLLWLAAKAGIDRKQLVLAACACAETALRFVPKGEGRPRKAIEAARAWCVGGATLKQVRTAADAAAYAAAAAADAVARGQAQGKHLRKLATIVRRQIKRPELKV